VKQAERLPSSGDPPDATPAFAVSVCSATLTITDFKGAISLFADPDFDGEPVEIYDPDPDGPPTPPTDDGDMKQPSSLTRRQLARRNITAQTSPAKPSASARNLLAATASSLPNRSRITLATLAAAASACAP